MYRNDPKNKGKNNIYDHPGRRRNITSESEVYSSKVYPIDRKRNKRSSSRRWKKKAHLWEKTKATVIGTLEYVEKRPRVNFGLFAIAQLFAGAGLPSLIAVGLLVLAMTLTAAKVYSSKEFINQGLAICGGLAIARIIQLIVTLLI